ncbi:MAG: glycogen debranching enzyme N-terminal domain-containing protein, partial [Victivallaceae bacterium]
MMFRAITLLRDDQDLSYLADPEGECVKFLNSPLHYCRNIVSSPISRVMVIDPARDCRRNVILPQRGLLLVRHHAKFRMVLKYEDMTLRSGMSVPGAHEHFTLLCIPHNRIKRNVKLTMYLSAYTTSGKTSNFTVHMQLLPDCEDNEIRTIFQRERVIGENIYAFGSNEKGSYTMFPAAFGFLRSKYDALLSANGQTPYPTERITMLTRCRMWLVCYGYSQQLDVEKLLNYTGGVNNRGSWLFRVPVGQGKSVTLKMQFKFSETSDAVTLLFHRYACRSEDELPDRVPVKLIIRPDVECRINHQLTKAFTGPEKLFPESVIAGRDAFEFSPYNHKLIVSMAEGEFHPEPQWNYMVELPQEKYYGLESNTDLFSPGYFQYKLKGDQVCLLRCVVDEELAKAPTLDDFKTPLPDKLPLSEALPQALRRYVVRRDD